MRRGKRWLVGSNLPREVREHSWSISGCAGAVNRFILDVVVNPIPQSSRNHTDTMGGDSSSSVLWGLFCMGVGRKRIDEIYFST